MQPFCWLNPSPYRSCHGSLSQRQEGGRNVSEYFFSNRGALKEEQCAGADPRQGKATSEAFQNTPRTLQEHARTTSERIPRPQQPGQRKLPDSSALHNEQKCMGLWRDRPTGTLCHVFATWNGVSVKSARVTSAGTGASVRGRTLRARSLLTFAGSPEVQYGAWPGPRVRHV